jgi:hypothetical protein
MTNQVQHQNDATATIHYQGLLHRIVGKPEEHLNLTNINNLGGLISFLLERHGEEFARALLTPAGELRSDVGILINGFNPARRGGLEFPIEAEAGCTVEIALLGSPPVGG